MLSEVKIKKEEVVLVDEENNVLKTVLKSEVHSEDTPLHRAFSSFIFNGNGDLLIQQRSHKKKTWPMVWSNTCCGHPSLDENNIEAATRRLEEELGIGVEELEEVSPYRYQFVQNGIMENEICPILVGFTKDNPKINDNEVENTQWIRWEDFLRETNIYPGKYSPWCMEQAKILNKNKRFREIRKAK
ncbi:MAG: isopentenyl-diphosphate Delta-isomerase [Patescibacteria group bacterium]